MKEYSVLMSVYYKERPEWLQYSIESMLNQTIKTNDFVIVEDGKLTDELEKVILEFCQKYPDIFNIVKLEENVGLGKALAVGIKKCKNEWIARMDSDDFSYPTRIEEQMKILEEDNEVELVGTNVNEFSENINNVVSYVELPQKQNEIYKFSKRRCPFRHPTLLYKKEAIINAGNYRHFLLYEDYDLYIRLLKNGTKCYNIQKPLVCMRINENFYKRRGGLKYLSATLKFKNLQLREGYFSFGEYLVSTIPHILICLVPNFIRKKVYINLLRKKANTND